MYKLIILDDEEIIRKGLVDFIPWQEIGFDMKADFEDGQDAIDYLKHHDVDVVLTDIIMAEVTGLQLAQYIYENKPKTKVVIVSGYKEFEFAQQAIQYNVQHYLLKPAQLEQIQQVFENIKEKLDEEQAVMREQQMDKQLSQALMPLFRDQFWTDLLMGALRHPDEIKRRIDLLSLPIAIANCCCLIDIEVKLQGQADFGSSSAKERIQQAIGTMFLKQQQVIQYFPLNIASHGFKVVAVWEPGMEEEVATDAIHLQLGKIKAAIAASFHLTFEARIESRYGNLLELATYTQQLKLVREDANGKLRLAEHEYDQLVEKYKLFMSNILEGNAVEAESLLDHFMEEFEGLPSSFTHRLIKDLFAVVGRTFAQEGIDVKELTGKITSHDMNTSDRNEILHLSKNTLEEVMKTTAPHKISSSNSIIAKAQQYIRTHFHEDLSLDSVADFVFLNPVYFCRLFKQYTGLNFTDYLTQIRVEEAIELLRTNKFKIYEVGQKVGYPNSKYFNRVFKKMTGSTPKEYCRNALIGS
ncbi:hypothetical protein A8709_05110 [Paenibacillus pectinilyticus]|uniref:DNA-binding response regulator n=1 Tax=Paenibacillus pectinilyticus TaxID=512399 RepID=A0A1C0ZSP1_9BACL|nr:response regulator [Paenibacillus pectinilyticus]OCT11077.1 hypothetical protein A8709_05110 [Paenibacillus pectinilyticus]